MWSYFHHNAVQVTYMFLLQGHRQSECGTGGPLDEASRRSMDT